MVAMPSYVVGSAWGWSRAATGRFPAGLRVDFTEGGEWKNYYEDKKKV